MTVAELIELLRSYPPALGVVVNGYEEGYDDISSNRISVRKIELSTGLNSWQGRHGDPGDRPGTNGAESVEALVFHRDSY